jgi:hypothetical protein
LRNRAASTTVIGVSAMHLLLYAICVLETSWKA